MNEVSGSYWHATHTPPVPDDPVPDYSEVIVIGAGLLGTWTAYWLARAGAKVTVLEKTAVSFGATGRNGGFLRGGSAAGYSHAIDALGAQDARALWELSFTGQRLAGEVVQEEAIDCDFRNTGTLHLHLSDDEHDAGIASMQLMHGDGFAGEALDRSGVQSLVHTQLAQHVTGGTWFEDGCLVHSGRYLAGVAAAARRHGARFCLAEVVQIRESASSVEIVTTDGLMHADRVVVALNAWSDQLVPQLSGIVVPVRGQILAYSPHDRVFDSGIGAEVTPTGEYWQQTIDGSIVIGGCRADAPGGDMGVREMVPTPEVVGKIEQVIPGLFPELHQLKVARSWAGLMAFTSDYVPVADAHPEIGNVWVTGGYCGHGMPFGPIVGKLLAEAATSGTTPDALGPLRIDRPSLKALTSG